MSGKKAKAKKTLTNSAMGTLMKYMGTGDYETSLRFAPEVRSVQENSFDGTATGQASWVRADREMTRDTGDLLLSLLEKYAVGPTNDFSWEMLARAGTVEEIHALFEKTRRPIPPEFAAARNVLLASKDPEVQKALRRPKKNVFASPLWIQKSVAAQEELADLFEETWKVDLDMWLGPVNACILVLLAHPGKSRPKGETVLANLGLADDKLAPGAAPAPAGPTDNRKKPATPKRDLGVDPWLKRAQAEAAARAADVVRKRKAEEAKAAEAERRRKSEEAKAADEAKLPSTPAPAPAGPAAPTVTPGVQPLPQIGIADQFRPAAGAADALSPVGVLLGLGNPATMTGQQMVSAIGQALQGGLNVLDCVVLKAEMNRRGIREPSDRKRSRGAMRRATPVVTCAICVCMYTRYVSLDQRPSSLMSTSL